MKSTGRYMRCLAGTLVVLLAGASPAVAGKEGFGFAMMKKAATVTRVNPPSVYLMGTKIAVKATSTVDNGEGLAQRLRTQLESELLGRDSRLTTSQNPDTLIEVSILQSEGDERWEQRRVSRLRKVGTDSKGKPILNMVEIEARFKVVTHSFSASYKVTDLVKNASLDADSFQYNYEKDFEDGKDAPQIFNLETSAIGRVVESVAQRLTSTKEKVGVLLPKGSLEDLVPLAEGGHWNKYLEALERRSPSAKPMDDSYRLYAIGTAYEALGYEAENEDTTLRYLEQADVYYNKALDANPGEKFFSQGYDSLLTSKTAQAPLDRVRAALSSYRRIKVFKEEYAGMQVAAKTAETSAGGKSVEVGSDPHAMNNAAVIKMVRAGLPEEVILTAINSAPQAQFDVSPQGLISLSEANVEKNVILRIQELAAKKTTAPKKSVSPKKSNS